MAGERQHRIKNLFREALSLEPLERRHFLAERCGNELELRSEVESLLEFHESEPGILDEPPHFSSLGLSSPPPSSRSDPGQRLVGTSIGNYRLLEFLGQGGMGVVFLAEQQSPVRRRLALKIVKSSAEATEILARFESERQALALMNHPSIARIFDADSTEDGRPYFTMEYVTGVPITEYCEHHRLSLSERLRLFLRVCEGVQHAHQKGILHRDLKPSNILVTVRVEGPVPKIIDFGVAKALHQPLTDASPVTAHGFLVGTPDYMSPEQAFTGGQDIDTRADIYSLGVLLYEMLTGVLPVDPRELRKDGYRRIQEKILAQDMPPPSLRLAKLDGVDDIAHRRRMPARSLRRRLRQDLDWITMKALEKDRTRRYPTVSDLAADIRRHLQGEPVQAGPPGVSYRLRKFVRKNRVTVIAAAAVVLALLSGLVASLNFAYRAESALEKAAASANQAQRSARRAEKITEYTTSVLSTASPRLGGSPELTIQEALARAETDLAAILTDTPGINAAVRFTIAEIHRDLGLYEQAAEHARLGVQELRAAPDSDPEELAAGLTVLALVLGDQARFAEAKPLLQEALALYREGGLGRMNPQVAWVLRNLVNISSEIDSFQETAARYRELIALQERIEGEQSVAAAQSHLAFGHFLARNALFDAGEVHLRRAVEIFDSLEGEGHFNTARARFYLGSLFRKKEEWETAAPLLGAAHDSLRGQLPADHRLVLMAERALAEALSGLGQYARAESLLAGNVAREREREGGSLRDVGTALIYQAEHYRRHGEQAKARACYEEAGRLAEQVYPSSGHALRETVLQELARFDQEEGDWLAARARLETCLDQRRARLRSNHPKTISTLADLARNLVHLGDLPAAVPIAEEFFTAALEEFGAENEQTRAAARLNLEIADRLADPDRMDRWRTWLNEAGDGSTGRENPPGG